jgi:hypothetical protein
VANICTPEAFEVTLSPKHRPTLLPIEPGEETWMRCLTHETRCQFLG